MQPYRPYKPVPPSMFDRLEEFCAALSDRHIPRDKLDAAIAEVAALPPGEIAHADGWIGALTNIRVRSRRWPWLYDGHPAELLTREPDLAWLFLFHRDGRLRQTSLERLDSGLPSPFYVVAVAYRLNDWAHQVRAAANACAQRVFSKTDAAVIAAAGLVLLERRRQWRRWDEEPAVLREALSRPEVVDILARRFRDARSGPMARALRHMLRWPQMDQHLPVLSRDAFLPAVRAAALHCLIEGRARWPSAPVWQWIDKVYNQGRLVTGYEERALARPTALEVIVAQGASDRSAAVRAVAADGAIRFRQDLANLAEIIGRLEHDRSPRVRERVAFLTRPPREKSAVEKT